MIEIKKLCKSYGDKLVLNNLSITIEDGKIFGLVGINGAGKSTLLRLISGIYKADCGDILVDGENVYENENKKKDIFFLPDEPYYGINTTPLNLVDLYLEFYFYNVNNLKACGGNISCNGVQIRVTMKAFYMFNKTKEYRYEVKMNEN